MRIGIASSSVAALFAIASPTAQAATACVYAHVETQYAPHVIGPNNTSCTTDNDTRECNRLLDQPLLVTDQNGVSTGSPLQREVFAPTNTGGVPNFLLTGDEHALALPGSLHASVAVEVTGTGAAFVPGVSGYGTARREALRAWLARSSPNSAKRWMSTTASAPRPVSALLRGRRTKWRTIAHRSRPTSTPRT